MRRGALLENVDFDVQLSVGSGKLKAGHSFVLPSDFPPDANLLVAVLQVALVCNSADKVCNAGFFFIFVSGFLAAVLGKRERVMTLSPEN